MEDILKVTVKYWPNVNGLHDKLNNYILSWIKGDKSILNYAINANLEPEQLAKEIERGINSSFEILKGDIYEQQANME